MREENKYGWQPDWGVVGENMHTALQEVAAELGGPELAQAIAEAADSDGLLPQASALKLLDDRHPGSADMVMHRTSEIGQERHEREIAAINKPSIRKFGRAILDGFGTFNLFGNRR
ncbi:MAG TPA: hypothetical protein VK694_00775 [Verrucomicrobiae bacterium]|nr:hypothetical protein [Verrucomicrobiae bacterium]